MYKETLEASLRQIIFSLLCIVLIFIFNCNGIQTCCLTTFGLIIIDALATNLICLNIHEAIISFLYNLVASSYLLGNS